MLTELEVHKILEQVGAVITDNHFVYTSGKHGSAYVNKDAVYPDTEITSKLCREMACRAVAVLPESIETVIAPAIGGVILSQWVAYHCSVPPNRKVASIYAEKSPEGDQFVIKRGYDKYVTGQSVLVVEDILNTGGSARKVVEAINAIGGKVAGVVVLCNRGGVTVDDLGIAPGSLIALTNIEMDIWDEDVCPLCQQGVPVNTAIGKGAEYLAAKTKA